MWENCKCGITFYRLNHRFKANKQLINFEFVK